MEGGRGIDSSLCVENCVEGGPANSSDYASEQIKKTTRINTTVFDAIMRLNRRGRNGPFVDQFEMGNKSALSALDRILGYVVGSVGAAEHSTHSPSTPVSKRKRCHRGRPPHFHDYYVISDNTIWKKSTHRIKYRILSMLLPLLHYLCLIPPSWAPIFAKKQTTTLHRLVFVRK